MHCATSKHTRRCYLFRSWVLKAFELAKIHLHRLDVGTLIAPPQYNEPNPGWQALIAHGKNFDYYNGAEILSNVLQDLRTLDVGLWFSGMEVALLLYKSPNIEHLRITWYGRRGNMATCLFLQGSDIRFQEYLDMCTCRSSRFLELRSIYVY